MQQKKITFLESRFVCVFSSLLFAFISVLFVQFTSCEASTYYMPDNFSTLKAAMAGMSGGDTLIIRDGVYKGAQNVIDDSYLPPSGSAGNYTTIKAENDWKVVFDGEDQRTMFYVWASRNYIIFKGIKWINNNDTAVHIPNWNYVKFLKCAFHCGPNALRVSTLWISSSTYILVEDCHAWGDGRYSINIQTSDHVVVRRFVSRLDAVNGSLDGAPYPAAHLMSYSSQYVEWQNCIALDSDQANFRSPASYYLGGFATHVLYENEYTEKNYYRGNIALNIDMHQPNPNFSSSPGPGFQIDNVKNNEYYNNVAWDIVGRGFSGSSLAGFSSTIDHNTLKNIHDPNGFGDVVNGSNNNVRNSILMNADRAGLRGSSTSTYASFYNNNSNYSSGATSIGNDITTVDPLDGNPGNGIPALKYLVRIESGSNLKGAGSSGDIGANILYKIGTSGTLYGENGYKDETGTPLWPFPYEDEIKADMSTYAGPPAGDRGFCASTQNLTNYIWGYLGNIVPPFNVKAIPGNELAVLTWDQPATAALAAITGFKIYNTTGGGKTLVGTVGDNATYTYTVNGLINFTTYEFVVATYGPSGESSFLTVAVTPAPVVQAPQINKLDIQ